MSVDEQPGAAPEKEGIIPKQIESYEETPWPRRSTRNLFPKYTKEINLHRVFPTSDDDNDIANLDSAMNAMMLDHPTKPFTPLSVLIIEP